MTPEVPLEIDCRTVKERIDAGRPGPLLDCRERDEYAASQLAERGASPIRIPMSELAERVSELEPHREAEMVVYCHHGSRSLRVALWLRRQGFAKARSMAGGLDRWSVEIDPSVPRY